MGILCGIGGRSGSGKSYSLFNMPPECVAVFNVANKPYPFRGHFPYKFATHDMDVIIGSLRNNAANCYVIDDSQYLMAFKLIDKINERGYEKYTEIASDFKKLVDTVNNETSPDTIVYLLHHTDTSEDGFTRLKTCGKMIDNWLTLEGLFSIVLMAKNNENKYLFYTQSDGTSTCKSPVGMFENPIPNDLKAVDDAIREYYELAPLRPVKVVEKPKAATTVTTSKTVPKKGE